MEYRRRRKRRNHRTGIYGNYYSRNTSKSEEGSGIFGAVLIIILTAGLIYILIGTSVGTLITQSLLKSCNNADSPSPTVSPYSDNLVSLNPETSISEEITFPSIKMFSLQMGVYSDSSTASGLVSSLKSLGAAGYVLETNNGYKVFASCYDTEAAAQSVCDRLRNQGYDCMLTPIECDEVVIKIDVGQSSLDKIKTACEYAHTITVNLYKEVINFDSEERSVEYGHAIIDEMITNINTVRNSISDSTDNSGILLALNNYYMRLESYMTSFNSSSIDNRVEVSGMLKHLQFDIIFSYVDFLNGIRSL